MAMKAFSSPSRHDAEESEKKSAAHTDFLKKWSRLFHGWRHRAAAARLKREIARLEKARRREKDAMTRQRRFYERLFRRNINALIDDVEKAGKPAVQAVEVTKAKMPAAALPPLPVPTPPPAVPAPPLAPVEIPLPPKPVPAPRSEVNEFQIDRAGFAAELAEVEELKPAAVPSLAAQAKPARELPPVPAPPVVASAEPVLSAPVPPQKMPAHKKLLGRFSGGSLAKKLAQEREQEKVWQERNEVEKRFWQPYTGVKPNLIKNQATVFFNWHEHFLILILSMVISCLVLSLVYVGLLVWQKERLDNNRTTILNTRAVEAEINEKQADIKEIIAFNNKLGLVGGLLDNHVYWTNFLNFLENNTLKDVYYENLTADLSGEYALPAISRSLEAVSLQLEVMKGDKAVSNINYDIKPAGNQTDRIFFNLGLSLKPEIFLK